MKTLTAKDFDIMQMQIAYTKGKHIEKAKVLEFLHKKLIEADKENIFDTDTKDIVLLKELINVFYYA